MPTKASIPNPTGGSRRLPSRLTSHWRGLALVAAVVLAGLAGGGLGYFMRLELPDVQALEDYDPPVTTRIFAGDGTLLHSFAEQHRMLIEYQDIPEHFREALVATEDAKFLRHTGIDIRGIVRAAWRDVRSRQLAQGASTLTQQLARNLFLHRDKTIRRKLQEAMLAIEIERQYTKSEILRFYCNQIYWGHGRYGLEAAARFYYGITARELSMTQAATLVGLLQRPESLSPIRHPERALERRNHVLRRMAQVGSLDEATAATAASMPLDPTGRAGSVTPLAPYFVEDVRRSIQRDFGDEALYRSGLEVHTTLDPELQEIANRAMAYGLRELDRRQGWRGAPARVPQGEDPETWRPASWADTPLEPGTVVEAVVVEAGRSRASLRLQDRAVRLDAEAIGWTKLSPNEAFDAGDVVRLRLPEEAGAESGYELEQVPLVEGSLIALDPGTGEILAMVGGFDFERSEFNRATQARRQTGSAFKPFVYVAALSQGRTLADTVVDDPTVFLDPNKPEPYQPENYSHHYYGRITLREALERSANIATVKLIDEIGYQPVIDVARRLGIAGRLRPFPSLALGAFESTLVELTSAYAAFANEGVWVEPHGIVQVIDATGEIRQSREPAARDAVTPQVAYLMNRALSGVVSDGTGRAAASLGIDIAGKTGTTDENTDAWFIGYSPKIAVGVWVGFDEPASLGDRETGARAALPIWRAFMEEAVSAFPSGDFVMPSGIHVVRIDRRTGLREQRRAYCRPVYAEVFIAGTEPASSCSVFHHQQKHLPHSFQHFEIDENGALIVPAGELDRLLASERGLRLSDGGRRLEYHGPQETIAVALRIVDGGELDPRADPRLEEFDVEEWIGKDGRPARVQWMGRGGTALRARN